MGFNLRKKRYYSLAGSIKTSVLAEITKSADGPPVVRIVSQVEGPVNDAATISRLLESAHISGGEISVSLPLNAIQITTLTLPNMPEGAIEKALPYHLAKTLDKPLSEYIYDWQITQTQQDRVHLIIYLFPAKIFHRIRNEFLDRQVQLTYLEADVFSAFAFLSKRKTLPKGETALCVLIWHNNISLAILEDNRVTLARNISSPRPTTPYEGPQPPPAAEGTVVYSDDGAQLVTDAPDADVEVEDESILSQDDIDNLLDNFNLTSQDESEPAMAPAPDIEQTLTLDTGSEQAAAADQPDTDLFSTGPAEPVNDWTDYLNSINLEIMRTRDYHSTIQKGEAIKNIFVGGADEFWDELQELSTSAIGLELKRLSDSTAEDQELTAPLLSTLCAGTGTRW